MLEHLEQQQKLTVNQWKIFAAATIPPRRRDNLRPEDRELMKSGLRLAMGETERLQPAASPRFWPPISPAIRG